MLWKKNNRGYTLDIDEAQAYDFNEAEKKANEDFMLSTFIISESQAKRVKSIFHK